MSLARAESAVVAARIVASAVDATTSLRNIGAALDVSHTAVERWAKGDAAAAFTLRDLIAAHSRGERDFAESVLSQIQALFAESYGDSGRPSHVACTILAVVGNVASVAVAIEADGRVDDAEEARFLDVLREADRIVHAERVARERR